MPIIPIVSNFILYLTTFIKISLYLFSNLHCMCKCILDSQDVYFCSNKCGRKYKSKTALYTHLKYECGVDPQFRCQVCQKSYKHKCTFKVHMIRDHGIVL